MAKNILYLALSLSSVLSLNKNCVDSTCSTCTGLNNYQSKNCLTNCPTGYSASMLACQPSGSGTSLVSTKFYEVQDFTANNINSVFKTSDSLAFNSPTRNSPIPTKERGFYFDVNSELIYDTNSHVIAPDFTLRLLFRVTGCSHDPCYVIRIYQSGSSIFTLSLNSTNITSTWSLQRSSDLSFDDHPLASDFDYYTWHKLIVACQQSQGYIKLTHTFIESYYDISSVSKVYNYEFRHADTTGLTYLLGGSGGSFQGFLYELLMDNEFTQTYLIAAFLVDCNYNQYYQQPQCLDCDPSCDTWPWCVRKGVCTDSYINHCYSKTCSVCTGYSKSHCGSIGFPCWRFCATCSAVTPYKCESCLSHLTLIDDKCIYYPYNYDYVDNDEPAISLTFEIFEQYYGGVFQSGSNGATYSPFHYPESDDPIPMLKRGLYFSNTSHLESISKISLYHENSFFIWAKPLGEGFNFWNSPSILLFSSGHSSLLLTNTDSWTRFDSIIKKEIRSWTFYAFVHKSVNSEFSSEVYLNGNIFSTYTAQGYFLYDIRTTIYILGEGFLYSINAYNSALVSVSDYYQNGICGNGLFGGCLVDCGPDEYFNETCVSCIDDCQFGCIQSDSCSLCFESDCLSCSSYSSAVCISVRNGTCAPSWPAFEDYNECCSSACWTCSGPFDYSCTSCYGGKVLAGSVCLDECPAGYEEVNGKCVLSDELIVDFTFDTIYDAYENTKKAITFKTGQDSSFYPDHILSDPFPAINRGLYFRKTSYLKSSNFTLSTSFVIVLWIKYYEYGQVFNKNFLNYFTGTSSSLIQITSSNAYDGKLPEISTWTSVFVRVWTGPDLRINSLFGSLTEKYVSYIGSFETVIDSNSEFVLGDSEDSFVGFIYKIKMYNFNSDISKLKDVKVCSETITGNCVWDCSIDYFWNGKFCDSCNSRCDSGCKDYDHCNICYDEVCHNCHDFTSSCDICKNHARFRFDVCFCNAGYYWELASETCEPCNNACQLCDGPTSNNCLTCVDSKCVLCTSQYPESCVECDPNYGAINGLCVQCTESQYYDSVNKICVDCEKPCWKCPNSKVCSECLPNASFNSEGVCECDQGFELKESCEQLFFTANFSISNKNVIKIDFSEDLLKNLKKSDLEVSVTTSDVQISIEKISKQVWKIHLDLSKSVQKGSRVNLDIVSKLLSSGKSIYRNKHYSALLYIQEDTITEPISDITDVAEGTVITVISVVLGSSLILFNPKSFFFFLQALELYFYILIYLVEISPGLQTFLQILNPASLFPNLLEFIIPSSQGVALSGKLKNFGYENNLFILNSGTNFLSICVLSCALPFIYFLNKVPVKWIKDQSTKALKNYKYRVVCRCYVQMFLEFLLNTFIGIKYNKFENPLQVFDFGLCVLFAVSII